VLFELVARSEVTIERTNARNETIRRPGNEEHYIVVYTARLYCPVFDMFILNLIRGIRAKIRKSIVVPYLRWGST